eukprot:COSAG01_NODE_53262_length_340_cov_1.261411_1_plen_80_part_01
MLPADDLPIQHTGQRPDYTRRVPLDTPTVRGIDTVGYAQYHAAMAQTARCTYSRSLLIQLIDASIDDLARARQSGASWIP